jgi:hypothetical protein
MKTKLIEGDNDDVEKDGVESSEPKTPVIYTVG